ncbi:MAG TPA: cation:proton antiporter [Pseudoflavonifractor sp.]|nr:cation:proton antiporter [Pseudoflavonifractor sp.]
MLTSLAYLFLLGLALGGLARRLRLPPLLGMLLTGILLGPQVLNLLSGSLLSISADLRQLALIIILTQAGLSLDVGDLRKAGRSALLMCFVPASFEIVGVVVLAPLLLKVTVAEAAVMGAVLAAVSPAVVVPRMLRLMDEGYGAEHQIPQIIMAGASADDVYVIVLFTAFTGLVQGEGFSAAVLATVPLSILTGILGGAAAGLLLASFFTRVHIRDSGKVLIFLSLSFLLVAAERALQGLFPFSGLLAVMAAGMALSRRRKDLSARLAAKFSKLWVAAEVLLFVLVGATVDLRYAVSAGLAAAAVLLGALAFRMAGVLFCMLGSRLAWKERLFCMLAYLPKATVQAAIGGVPLSMGLSCGNLVLTVAVLSILITAPLGAALIDRSYQRLLTRT